MTSAVSTAATSINLRNQLDKELKHLSFRLIPSETEQQGRAKANEIFDILRSSLRGQNKPYGIDRAFIGGSMGKRTAIETPDYDLVAFVNVTTEPPLIQVLADFDSILRPNGVAIVKRGDNSMQLKYQGFDIDLLAAKNMVANMPQQPGGKELAALQALGTLKKIQENPPVNYYKYGSGLVQSQLDFVREQSSFVHDAIKICKYWVKKRTHIASFSGKCTIVEVIASKAAVEEEASGKRSLVNTIENFLKKIVDFENLEIKFDFDPLEALRAGGEKWTPHVGPSLKKKPYVIEPANPFNNLAREIKGIEIEQLKKAARATLNKIQNYKSGDKIEDIL